MAEYVKLQRHVEELVGHVNGRHSTASYTPVIYMHRNIPFNQLGAMYALADLCIVSPIRDGLNLVSYEYVVCQAQKAATSRASAHHRDPGILLLSQYTGAAITLRSALVFNPWDTPRFADTVKAALNMPSAERRRRHDACICVVEEQTSVRWGEKFLHALETMQVDDLQPNDEQQRKGERQDQV